MKHITILGAKNFINQPKGTFYMKYKCHTKEKGKIFINSIKKYPEQYINEIGMLKIYGNCQSSLNFCIPQETDDYSNINNFYYVDSTNIDDSITFYVILNESNIPIQTGGFLNVLPKQQIFDVRDKFLLSFNSIDNVYDKANIKARSLLTTEDSSLNDIYNFKLTINYK